MFENLIKFEELWECCSETFGFGQVTLLRDFGPYKKGDKVSHLWFDLEKGEVTEFADDGVKEVRRFPFSLTA